MKNQLDQFRRLATICQRHTHTNTETNNTEDKRNRYHGRSIEIYAHIRTTINMTALFIYCIRNSPSSTERCVIKNTTPAGGCSKCSADKRAQSMSQRQPTRASCANQATTNWYCNNTVLIRRRERLFGPTAATRRLIMVGGYCVITVSTVVLNCCKGDRPIQWETQIFGPLQLENHLTDFDEICYQ